MKFILPDLPYDYKALEPYFDEKTMMIHHSKHHAGYTNNLNLALEPHAELHAFSIEHLLKNLERLPESIQTTVKNNGGGFYNHSLFWTFLSPRGGGKPEGKCLEAIEATFQSFEQFVSDFKQAALRHFGSGWTWLVISDGNLEIMSTANQDSPISDGKEVLLGVDVWEHAYYIKYQNRRAEFLDAFFEIVNWETVAKRFEENLS